jgi:hypothetical protein
VNTVMNLRVEIFFSHQQLSVSQGLCSMELVKSLQEMINYHKKNVPLIAPTIQDPWSPAHQTTHPQMMSQANQIRPFSTVLSPH